MTRTSRAGNSSSSGFTLLELLAVLFIISIFFTLALPRIRHMNTTRSDALKVAAILRDLNDSAIARKENYDITFDLEGKVLKWLGPDGKKEFSLNNLVSVTLPSRGELKEGSLQIFFGPDGAMEDISVLLADTDSSYRITFREMSGKVEVNEEAPA